MNKIKRFFLISLLVAASAIPFAFTANNYFEISKNMDIFATLFKELNTYYVDEIDANKIMRAGIDAMLETLDPHTEFYSEAEIEDYRIHTTGKYGGIGAIISQEDSQVMVLEPYEGFPAHKAGLRPGDIFLQIDGKSAEGKTTEEVKNILRGTPGTEIKVKVKRSGTGEVLDKILVREEVKINNVPYYGMVNDSVGYIKLSHFTEKAGKEVQNALKELKEQHNVKALIFDMRNNGGGLLHEAINVTNTFIPKGQLVVTTKGKISEWEKTYKTLGSAVDIDIPVAVLVNRASASASEIVSGAIQDYDRGVILGERTFGKGLVQTTRPLNYNTQLKVTTAKYYIPSGRCIQAIDYSLRNEDGSVGRIPDSLQTPFKTQCGRVVYDGGGIDPDIQLEQQKLNNVTIALLRNRLPFKYANQYRNAHEALPGGEKFQVTDEVFNDFVKFVEDKEYDYTTKSEELLKELRETAQKENYFNAVEGDLDDLQAKIKHDKEKDLFKHKEEIKELLEEEIISRYYYQKGKIFASFDDDPGVTQAVNLFASMPAYYDLLKAPSGN